VLEKITTNEALDILAVKRSLGRQDNCDQALREQQTNQILETLDVLRRGCVDANSAYRLQPELLSNACLDNRV